MNRDDATKIAKRIMDRIEQDRAIHLDAMVDEIVAGMALAAPAPHRHEFLIDDATGGTADFWAKLLAEEVRNRTLDDAARRVGRVGGHNFIPSGIYTNQLADDTIGLGSDKLLADTLSEIINEAFADDSEEAEATIKREGGPAPAHPGDWVGNVTAILNGWSDQDMRGANFDYDYQSQRWVARG